MDEQLEIARVPIEEITAEVMTLTCTEDENGDLIIEWDETDPQAISLGINEWTEERWNQLLMEAVERAGDQLLRGAAERSGVLCDEVSQPDATQPTEAAD